MKITSLKIRLLTVDARSYFAQAKEKREFSMRWEYPLVEIQTDAGHVGYSMGRGTHGEGRALAYTLRDVYAHRLIGIDPVYEHEFIWQKLKRDNRHLYSLSDAALGTLDVALWDLRGKAANLPISALLGQYRDKVPTYATLGRQQLETPEAIQRACSGAQAAGYPAIKVQLWSGPDRDIPRLRESRKAVGDDFRLMVDAAAGYTLTEALRVGHVLDELDYYWFEEPVSDSQIGNLRTLREELRTPIIATETTRLNDLHNYLREGAVDIMRGDAYITSGITGLRKAMAMAELFGLNLEIHAAGSPLIDVAHVHVACATRNCEYVETPPDFFRFGFADHPLDMQPDGNVLCPTGPGLGVELDWDWINAHTVLTLDCSHA